MPESYQSSLLNRSEWVSESVTDKHCEWSDSGPIKIPEKARPAAGRLEKILQFKEDHFRRLENEIVFFREIDNFFPAVFKYLNIREWDVEETDLLK